jgi:hypothetical protein
MTMKRAERTGQEPAVRGDIRDLSARQGPSVQEYEPPVVQVLGSITDFTFGSGGTKGDGGTFTRA